MNPSPPSTPDAELRVLADLTAPALARWALRSALEDAVQPQVLLDVLIVASELVTNAVLHAGLSHEDAITLRMWSGPPIRLEVEDDGAGLAQEPEGAGGWGLRVVSALSESWGLRLGRGALAWAVLRAPHRPRGAATGPEM